MSNSTNIPLSKEQLARLANSQWIVSLDCPAPDHHWQHGRNFYWELLSATGAARPMGNGRGTRGVCVYEEDVR